MKEMILSGGGSWTSALVALEDLRRQYPNQRIVIISSVDTLKKLKKKTPLWTFLEQALTPLHKGSTSTPMTSKRSCKGKGKGKDEGGTWLKEGGVDEFFAGVYTKELLFRAILRQRLDISSTESRLELQNSDETTFNLKNWKEAK